MYSKNIKKIAIRFWPNRRKATLKNVILVGTAQALTFTSLYIGGSFAVMGLNPIALLKNRKNLIGGPTDEEIEADEKKMQEAISGMSMSDAIVLRTFKAMGVSDTTMINIEKDLRQ